MSIGGKLKEKLVDDKESAFFSKKIATIYLDVPIEDNLEDMKYTKERTYELTNLF